MKSVRVCCLDNFPPHIEKARLPVARGTTRAGVRRKLESESVKTYFSKIYFSNGHEFPYLPFWYISQGVHLIACISQGMHLPGHASHGRASLRACISQGMHLLGYASPRASISQGMHLIVVHLMAVYPSGHPSLRVCISQGIHLPGHPSHSRASHGCVSLRASISQGIHLPGHPSPRASIS
jgi:hypothetical protein